jgi:hypothetical protein
MVSGNQVRTLLNTVVGVATTEILFRDHGTAPNVNYANAVTQSRAWVDEWSSFWVEIWVQTTDGARITNFSCTIAYDPTLFTFSHVVGGPGVNNVTGAPSPSGNQITVTGTSTALGSSSYVLLARALFRPATPTASNPSVGVDVPNLGYAVGEHSRFAFSNMNVTTGGANGRTGVSPITAQPLTVYPVLYDFNNDGRVDLNDFLAFLRAFGRPVGANPAQSELAKFDFTRTGTVNLNDFLLFLRAFGKTRAAAAHPTVIPSQPYVQFPTGSNVPWAMAATQSVTQPLSSPPHDVHDVSVMTNYDPPYEPRSVAAKNVSDNIIEAPTMTPMADDTLPAQQHIQPIAYTASTWAFTAQSTLSVNTQPVATPVKPIAQVATHYRTSAVRSSGYDVTEPYVRRDQLQDLAMHSLLKEDIEPSDFTGGTLHNDLANEFQYNL